MVLADASGYGGGGERGGHVAVSWCEWASVGVLHDLYGRLLRAWEHLQPNRREREVAGSSRDCIHHRVRTRKNLFLS